MSAHTAFWWVLNGGPGAWIKVYLIGPTVVLVTKEPGAPGPLAQAIRFSRPSLAKRYAIRLTGRREVEEGYALSKAGVWVGEVDVDLPDLEERYRIPRMLGRQIAVLTGQMASNGKAIT